MARFEVFPHPDASLRTATPYLMDVQNDHIDRVGSRVVIPLRFAKTFGPTMRDLNPVFDIAGKAMVLDTAALAAFPAKELKKPVAGARIQREDVLTALDTLFGGY